MNKIALLIPVCSRGQKYTDLSSTPFMKYLFPSFKKYEDPAYTYSFFIGYDSTDEFYNTHINNLPDLCEGYDINLIKLNGCEHKPAKAWNILFKEAYDKKNDYFYQIGDDIVIKDPWANVFVDLLKSNNNIGVIGACHFRNYQQRLNSGMPPVIENAFVHRMHYLIFGTFFDERIDNWFCDNWITEIYKPDYSIHNKDLFVKNMIWDDRYKIKNIIHQIEKYISEGKEKLNLKISYDASINR